MCLCLENNLKLKFKFKSKMTQDIKFFEEEKHSDISLNQQMITIWILPLSPPNPPFPLSPSPSLLSFSSTPLSICGGEATQKEGGGQR